MDKLIPWSRLENKLAKHYPNGETGIEKRDGHPGVDWLVALRPGRRAQLPPSSRLAQGGCACLPPKRR